MFAHFFRIIFISLFLLGFVESSFAQKKGGGPTISGPKSGTSTATSHTGKQRVLRLPKYDRGWFHPGFLLGMNYTSFAIRYVPDIKKYDSVYAVRQIAQPGFDLGIIGDFRLSNHFSVRIVPTLQFVERKIDFEFSIRHDSSYVKTKPITSYLMMFPIDFKYRSERINNWRAYLVAGGRGGFDMGSNSKLKDKSGKDLLKLQKLDYGVEVGFGFEFYLDYFKLSPEIKMYYGLSNQVVKDGGVFSNPIERLNTKMFMFTLNFE